MGWILRILRESPIYNSTVPEDPGGNTRYSNNKTETETETEIETERESERAREREGERERARKRERERERERARARACERERERRRVSVRAHSDPDFVLMQNKVETAVRLTHRPTGIVVTASEHRSQWQNRQVTLG
jgi:hypothetical protein